MARWLIVATLMAIASACTTRPPREFVPPSSTATRHAPASPARPYPCEALICTPHFQFDGTDIGYFERRWGEYSPEVAIAPIAKRAAQLAAVATHCRNSVEPITDSELRTHLREESLAAVALQSGVPEDYARVVERALSMSLSRFEALNRLEAVTLRCISDGALPRGFRVPWPGWPSAAPNQLSEPSPSEETWLRQQEASGELTRRLDILEQ